MVHLQCPRIDPIAASRPRAATPEPFDNFFAQVLLLLSLIRPYLRGFLSFPTGFPHPIGIRFFPRFQDFVSALLALGVRTPVALLAEILLCVFLRLASAANGCQPHGPLLRCGPDPPIVCPCKHRRAMKKRLGTASSLPFTYAKIGLLSATVLTNHKSPSK